MSGAGDTITTDLTVDVLGEPIPQGSMKAVNAGGRARIVSDNPRLRGWRRTVAETVDARMRHTGAVITDQPVAVTITFWLPRPPSIPKRRRYPSVRPDVDKLARACLDALTGTAVTDDSRVVQLTVTKRYATGQCGARIVVTPLDQQGALL